MKKKENDIGFFVKEKIRGDFAKFGKKVGMGNLKFWRRGCSGKTLEKRQFL